MTALERMAPWHSEPLDEKTLEALFNERINVRRTHILLGRSAILAGWGVGISGGVMMAASVAGWLTVLPLKTVEVRYFLVDKTTGIISKPVAAEDAPQLMTEATDHRYLITYLQACEGWIPERDRENAYLCELMSRPDQQARYAAWRKSPKAPQLAVGKDGQVAIGNFRWHRNREAVGGQTRSYTVQFDRLVSKTGEQPKTETWHGQIDFQYHPELRMTLSDRDLSPSGFMAIAYSAEPDNNPDQGHQ